MPEPAAPRPDVAAPPALRVAAVVAAVQGLATVVLAVVEGLAVDGDRLMMGLTTAAFFAAYGALLVVSGIALWRPHRWARGPVLFAQLVWLGVAWSLHSGSATGLGVAVAVSAAVCLVALLLPASLRAVDAGRYDD